MYGTRSGRGRGNLASGRGGGAGAPQPAGQQPAPGPPGAGSSSSSSADSESLSGSEPDSGSSSSSNSLPNPLAALQLVFPGPAPAPPLVFNPLYHSEPDIDDDMQRYSLPHFTGREKGAAGEAYLRAFHDAVGMSRWGTADEGLYRSLFIFASGGSAASTNAQGSTPFDLWCDVHVRPLAQDIMLASQTCLDAASHQSVYNQYRPRYDSVFDLFKSEFCGHDVSEFQSLLSELASVCQNHSNSAVWRPLQHALLKVQGFYSRPVPSGVMSESEFVSQLLGMSDLLPATVSLRIQHAVDGLTAAQLPAAPANAPAGWNPKLTLAAVLSAVSELAKQQHQAAGWGLLASASSGVSPSAVLPSQHSVSATSSLLQATDVNSKAAAMCAGLQHMSAEGRCQVLAKAFPDALCPEHRMLHPLKDCPFATAEKPKGVVKHVHATSLADEASLLSDGIVKRVTAELESVMDSKLSVFAAGYRSGQGDYGRSHYDSDRRGGGGGYGQPKPIGAGFQDGYNTRASPHRARPSPVVCNVCECPGHAEDQCWIVFPHKCRDARMLDNLVVPEHLQGLFQRQLAKMRSERGQPPAPEPLPGDTYPPRAGGQQHVVLNHCVVSDLSDVLAQLQAEGALVYVDDVAFGPADPAALSHSFATVGIEFGDEELADFSLTASGSFASEDSYPMPGLGYTTSDEEELPALQPAVPVHAPKVADTDTDDDMPPLEPISPVPSVALVDVRFLNASVRGPESSDSEPSPLSPASSEPSSPGAAPVVPEPSSPSCAVPGCGEVLVCACGSACRLQLEAVSEGGVAPVWQCPSAASTACVSGEPADGSALVQAFVARYTGTMPASFRPAANVSMVTRSAARAAAQAAQASNLPVPVAPAPVEPAVPSVVDTAQVAPVEPTAVPAPSPATVPAQDPPSALRSGGTGRAARQPVSFAPDLASAYRQSVPGVPGLIESSVTNGFVVVPVGNVAHLLSAEAQRQLGVGRVPASAPATAGSVPADPPSAAQAFVVQSRSAVAPRREVSVCQLAQPEGRPRDCMFVRTPEGVLRLPKVVYGDTASDCSIIKASVAKAFGIHTEELPGRTVHMSTVGGVFSQPTVVTKPVMLVFNLGARELRAHVVFLVADVEALPYDIILGTPVLDALGAEFDFKTESLKLFPRWANFRDTAVSVRVPLSIKSKANPRSLPIAAPVVAAAQAAAVVVSAQPICAEPAVSAPVLCCDPQATACAEFAA